VNATAKFYTGFLIALAIVVAFVFSVGYRAGYTAHRPGPGAPHRSTNP